MKKLQTLFLLGVTFIHTACLFGIHEADTEIARVGGGGRVGGVGGVGGRIGGPYAGGYRSGVGTMQRTPSLARAYTRGAVAGAAATGGRYYYANPSSSYYYPQNPYYYYYTYPAQ